MTGKVEKILSFRAYFVAFLLFWCRQLKVASSVVLGFWLKRRAASYFLSKKFLMRGKRVLEPRPSTFCSFSFFFYLTNVTTLTNALFTLFLLVCLAGYNW